MVEGVVAAVAGHDELDAHGQVVRHPEGGHRVLPRLDVLQVVDPVQDDDDLAVVRDLLATGGGRRTR